MNANRERKGKVDKAIRAACEEIRTVSASFPGDVESWVKIIKRHLAPILAVILLSGCADMVMAPVLLVSWVADPSMSGKDVPKEKGESRN